MSSSTEAATPDQPQPVSPVRASERLASLDSLRGVAVLGILVMNIYAFAMPFAAYNNPLVMGGTDALNLGTWFVTHILFDQKFLAIFAMMYGAGIVLLSERAEARGAKIAGVFFRRSFWLLVFGLLHGYLFWFGDILFAYAVIGMLVFLFRRRTPRQLIIIGLLVLPVANLLSAGGGMYMQDLRATAQALEQRQAAGDELSSQEIDTIRQWHESQAFVAPDDKDIARDVEAFRGSYADAIAYRAPIMPMIQVQGTFFFLLWRAGGLMLIGMALMKLGVLGAARSVGFYRNMMLAGYGIGLPVMVYSSVDLYANDFDPLYAMQIGMLPNYWGSILVGLGHIGLTMMAVKSGVLSALMRRFAAVGRMAFTNYLTHTIVMTTVFYGYGLNLYTEVPRFYQMFFVAGLIALQLIYSPWWLDRFRFGPAEWLWRSLTYWKRQPMRR